jgi:hypothetical protein
VEYVASKSLAVRIGHEGAAASFANNVEGITALAGFCRAHQVELSVDNGQQPRGFSVSSLRQP